MGPFHSRISPVNEGLPPFMNTLPERSDSYLIKNLRDVPERFYLRKAGAFRSQGRRHKTGVN